MHDGLEVATVDPIDCANRFMAYITSQEAELWVLTEIAANG
jgi:hypothetical protein